MAKIRSIPFGYHIQDGILTTEKDQADVVRYIFTSYLEGTSVAEIIRHLTTIGIPYHSHASPCWNKNNIYRILSDCRYTGSDAYPQIISKQLFDKINSLRAEKNIGKTNPIIRSIRHKIVCPYCTNAMIRITHSSRNDAILWQCKTCSFRTTGILDLTLVDLITQKINAIIEAPAVALLQESDSQTISCTIAKLKNEFDRLISSPHASESELLQFASQIAQEEYRSCKEGELQADNHWLAHLIQERKENSLSMEDFIRQAIREIQLSPNGQITIKLINNKLL